jgi:hypothetical protein
LRFGIGPHRPELVKREELAVEPYAHLAIKNRAGRRKPHGERREEHNG